jgi:hypothetical protein
MKLLFLVHGVGVHPKGWSDDVRDKLDAAAAQYAEFGAGRPRFSERVTVAEIQYDTIFDDLVARWREQADALDAFSRGQGRPLPRLVQWLRGPLPGDTRGFFWSTALDALLYRGFALVRDHVRASVMSQFVTALTEHMATDSVEASVLAHSLGTGVTHDVLHLLGSSPVGDNEAFHVSRFQFENIFMLADTALLGPKAVLDIDPATSIVRPSSAGADGGYCQFFMNVWHRFDPVAVTAPFRPTTWGDGYTPVGPLEHFHEANVHAFDHYLDNPAVHVPIINATLGFAAVTADEARAARAAYPQIGSPECSAQIAALKAKVTEFDHAGEDLEDFVIRTSEFYALARRSAESCRGLLPKKIV